MYFGTQGLVHSKKTRQRVFQRRGAESDLMISKFVSVTSMITSVMWDIKERSMSGPCLPTRPVNTSALVPHLVPRYCHSRISKDCR